MRGEERRSFIACCWIEAKSDPSSLASSLPLTRVERRKKLLNVLALSQKLDASLLMDASFPSCTFLSLRVLIEESRTQGHGGLLLRLLLLPSSSSLTCSHHSQASEEQQSQINPYPAWMLSTFFYGWFLWGAWKEKKLSICSSSPTTGERK